MSTLSGRSVGQERPVSRGMLWFGALGGGFAWVAHLMGAYTISEFGCLGRLNRESWLGVTVVAWLLLVLSAAALSVAVIGTFVARGCYRKLQTGSDTTARSEADFARAAWMASGLFSFVILVQSIPVIYYLKHC